MTTNRFNDVKRTLRIWGIVTSILGLVIFKFCDEAYVEILPFVGVYCAIMGIWLLIVPSFKIGIATGITLVLLTLACIIIVDEYHAPGLFIIITIFAALMVFIHSIRYKKIFALSEKEIILDESTKLKNENILLRIKTGIFFILLPIIACVGFYFFWGNNYT